MRKACDFALSAGLAALLLLGAGCPEPPERDAGTTSRVTGGAYEKAVGESARFIPVAYDVDVLVVGGSSGGVAAAVGAAEKGASVFLTAQRPYLGEDICGTYRLWLEPDEIATSPLAKKVFAEMPRSGPSVRGAAFTYSADKPSAAIHRDTRTPSLLTDGKWHNAATQSVQYDGDVIITADLGKERELRCVYLMAYQRRNPGLGSDFEVESVAVSLSGDGDDWTQAAVARNAIAGQALSEPWGPVELSAAVSGPARYVKLAVKKSKDVERVLIGEIIIEDKQASERPAPARKAIAVTPMQVKRVLDEALLDAGVEFLYGCYATDVLWDDGGNVAGIVMANRSGRQRIRAKVVIDATPRAAVARMAGATFEAYPAGVQRFRRVVAGAEVVTGDGISASKVPAPPGSEFNAIEYSVDIPMTDGSFASFARAEQVARDKTWHPGQNDSSEVLFQVPPDPMKGSEAHRGPWPGAEKVGVDVFRPAGVERLFVVGGCADVSRGAAEKLLRPAELMAVGGRVGKAAASEAANISKARHIELRGLLKAPAYPGDIREDLSGIRSMGVLHGSRQPRSRSVPVLAEYDVVVVGGGTGGAPAGISAARQGARTLVVEYLHNLGGVGTVGLISKYYYGYIKGFTKEIDQGVGGLGPGGQVGSAWSVELKQEWYRRELRKAGADIWFGVLGCGAFVDKGCVKGVVVATPEGRGVVLAKVVIDSTGNADIAAAAGAACVYTNGTGVAVQGSGLPPRKLGAGYTNTDWTFIDDGDVLDAWRSFVTAKKKFKGAYDLGQLLDTRERRRIVGDFVMSPMDISLGRTYPDTIVIARSNFDSHGFAVHEIFMLRPPDRKAILVNVPYRCLLPKGLEGILVTGLGVSAHRDAMPVIRMQPDIQNQGYAAGVAAAMAAESGKSLRNIDLKLLQKHLVDKGNLPERVLTDIDSMPLPKERVVEAVRKVVDDFEGLEVVLAQPADSMPLLKEAYKKTGDEKAKLAYAHIVGMLGDATGADTLLEAVKSGRWDKGWNYTGMGQYGASVSPLDSMIIALGRTGDKRALEPIVEKVEQLNSSSEFSHHRAAAMALEALADPRAAAPLAGLLRKPRMMGHAFTDIAEAMDGTPNSGTDTSTRNASLKELVLARALYRCGDYDGLGREILKKYERDLRAHYARHARAILRN
ncbi:MAG: FAD-dependent oxidoreductase [Phycisphaerales bacterium]|nr:MAG: FAD-dependent oxidoreductase [Phycisphaerales bacterium]